MAGLIGYIQITEGLGTKMKVTKENGVNTPHHIIDAVLSEDAYVTDTLTLVASTPTLLSETAIVIKQIFVRADANNTEAVYILGDSGEPAKGYPLSPGESIPIVVDDVSKIYVYTTGTGEKVSYIGS